MTKKIFTVLLAVVLVFAFAGCAGKAADEMTSSSYSGSNGYYKDDAMPEESIVISEIYTSATCTRPVATA